MSEAISRVVLGLMKSPEADATLDVLREDHPDVSIEDRQTYWHLTHEKEIHIDLQRVGEELGEPIALSEWLVIMTTFVGRVETEPDSFLVTTAMLQLSED